MIAESPDGTVTVPSPPWRALTPEVDRTNQRIGSGSGFPFVATTAVATRRWAGAARGSG